MNRLLRHITRLSLIGLAYLASGLVFPATALAYVDPGSGSVIVTTILGLIAAVGYTFRKYFYRLKRLFSGKKPAEGEQTAESEQKD